MGKEIQDHIQYYSQYYTSFVYHVPSSFLGMPTFNRDVVIANITNELERSGYVCEFLNKQHTELRISWDHVHAQAQAQANAQALAPAPSAPSAPPPPPSSTAFDSDDSDSDNPMTVEVPTVEDVLKKYVKSSRGRGRGRTRTRARGRSK